MPELPEVETSCNGIRPHIINQKISDVIVRNHRLRWPVADNLRVLLRGQQVQQVTRRAKYILIICDSGTLVIHLGMSGNVRICDNHLAPKKHDHADIAFNDICLRYHDPRRFGSILWVSENLDEHPLFRHLGPEPLSDQFNANWLKKCAEKRKTPIKTFIMNASVVVGVGNIYANESLFAARINPNRACSNISLARYEILVQHIKNILQQAITQGGTTLKDFVNEEGKPGYFAQQLKVYGRTSKPCVNCQRPIQSKQISQRSTFYCTHCQR